MNLGIKALFVCLIFICQTLYAVEVEGIYEVEVVAKSEQETDRVAAIKQAMTIVLSRVLEGDNILQDDTVKKILADATYYVNEFQYSLVAIEQKNVHARLMRVLFDETRLVDSLRTGKIGVWNEIRPRTLVWIVVEAAGKQRFFDASVMPEIDFALTDAAQKKALPVLYPMQDLEEQQILSIADVLSAYSDHLLDVSLRYDVVSTLAGKLVKEGSCWKAEWTFYFDAKIAQWRSACMSVNKVALNGFQGVYQRLSTYYAVSPDIEALNSVLLKVSHIKNISELAGVTDYIESLAMVKTVAWVNVEDGYNIYRVFYQGERVALNKALVEDRVLSAEGLSEQSREQGKYKLVAK